MEGEKFLDGVWTVEINVKDTDDGKIIHILVYVNDQEIAQVVTETIERNKRKVVHMRSFVEPLQELGF